ncbi:MAG TPA: aminotransferase class I/II-fold pyridoxal phosphate-dependent enzyme [Trueperaceae bacterium]|nr:aminotransferase class I/II-fold pyridoxal phosphate-dependent enzyme [Trueperaceae bacterium]
MSGEPMPPKAAPTATPRGPATRVAGFQETVFATYSRLARERGAIDLGQGFPDFDPPDFVVDALRRSADGFQQYAPLGGLPELTGEVAADLSAGLARDLDPAANLLVTDGATEGLFACMQALIDPGDEVLLLEPFYDAYPADVVMAGGVPRYLPLELQGGRWTLDPDRLRAAVTDRTRAIVVNTPHNPTGKVFTAAELDLLVAEAARVNALLISDEVYERIAFEGHVPLAGRPGAWERTLTVASLGKTFSVTGWKVGWVSGPEPLVRAVRMAHQWIPFTVATPLQAAGAAMLRHARESGYYRELADDYRRRRDALLAALEPTPFRPFVPDGGYFVLADARLLGYEDDVALCRDLPGRVGVGAIPPSAFYADEHKSLARHLVRFAYCKDEGLIRRAGERLQALG